jgi:helvolic acid biosynthesis 3-ketosteroid Delta1-dehydrogenase
MGRVGMSLTRAKAPRTLLRISPRTVFASDKALVGVRRASTQSFDRNVDVLVVGSGAAGLTAALRAKDRGLNALVVEKLSHIGGSSAYSGGGLWIPNNHLHRAVGTSDSFDNAVRYLESIVGPNAGPASSRARKEIYVQTAPQMVEWLESQGFEWHASIGYPDYHPEAPGGLASGRTIEPKIFNEKRLGPWRDLLQRREGPAMPPFYADKVNTTLLFRTTWAGKVQLARLLLRIVGRKLLGQNPLTLGQSLVAQLLALNIAQKTDIVRQTSLSHLIVNPSSGAVEGAAVTQEGRELQVRAKNGVLLTAGGFARHGAMRAKYQPPPSTTDWTLVSPGDTGDAVRAGMDIGASVALMDDAWWYPTIIDPATGINNSALVERARPHSIVVDSAGKRFTNEAESYTDFVHRQYERHQKVPAIPAWLIIDSQYRKKYFMGGLMPGASYKKAIASEYIVEGSSLSDLASKIGVDAFGLEETIARFNEMARTGEDIDYGRGNSAYDRWFGDPSIKPNPNLGTIEKGPFYALKIFPGDLGTKGGLLTDENARVLRDDGSPIEGLYAAGNTSASVMGRTYAGAGATLGPAMTFAFLAVDHISSR